MAVRRLDPDMRIHHLGVATEDAGGLADLYTELLGTRIVHEEEFDGMRIVFLETHDGYFELLEPLDDGTIARFIDDRGPGIHHVAMETEDVARALESARDLGIELVDETPRPGAWGHEVAFLHPGSTGGVLIEFVGA